MEIELNNNNLYYNQNEHSYNHMKLSKNPNHFHEEIKPDSAIEDGGIISSNEKKNDKKDKKNWDINTNIENDENNINNENFDNEINNNKDKNEEDEEKIDDDMPYQSKVSDINNDNNINNENNIGNDDNNVNNLIDDENSSSRNEKIDKNQEGMSEKNY